MITTHDVYFRDASAMAELPSGSVNLVVTSPPYPMIEMWDALFSSDPKIRQALETADGKRAHELMHRSLDRVWREADRALRPTGVICINIGDATRTLNGEFRLYPNHVRVSGFFIEAGYDMLPLILWRKRSNKPNKFMGSGMIPPNAYVTLEHEYILIFRKGGNRRFPRDDRDRRRSAYFREERNTWFSDVWSDLRGVPQRLNGGGSNGRDRSAAYPFELPFRLINMYSLQGDVVLDPFAGTGTTALAAIASGRNSVGYEIDATLEPVIDGRVTQAREIANSVAAERLNRHTQLENGDDNSNARSAYRSRAYGFSVKTSQETDLKLPIVEELKKTGLCRYKVAYR